MSVLVSNVLYLSFLHDVTQVICTDALMCGQHFDAASVWHIVDFKKELVCVFFKGPVY